MQEMSPGETVRSKRTALRVPVDFQVKCAYSGNGKPPVMARAVNMSTGGLFITTSEPIQPKVRLVLEFLMPATMNSIQVEGESVWSRPFSSQEKQLQGIGIRFVNLEQSYFNLIRDYALSKLYDREFVEGEGIVRVLNDIRNLPPEWRLKAYNILIKKGGKNLSLSQSASSLAK